MCLVDNVYELLFILHNGQKTKTKTIGRMVMGKRERGEGGKEEGGR